MKRGTVILLFSTIAYIVAVLYLVTYGFNLEKDLPGEEALRLLGDVPTGHLVQLTLAQTARNAMYATGEHMGTMYHSPKSIGAETIFNKKGCLTYNDGDRIILFSPGACTITKEQLKKTYLATFKRYFTTFLAKPLYGELYGFSLTLPEELYDFSLVTQDGAVTVVGKAKQNIVVKGEELSYGFDPSFSETIPYDLYEHHDLYELFASNLDCIQKHGEQFVTQCGFPKTYTWTVAQLGDYLHIQASPIAHKRPHEKLFFIFTINLKTLRETNSLFPK